MNTPSARPRLNAICFALAIEELVCGPCTKDQLMEATGLGRATILRLITALHRRGLIHVSGWDADSVGRLMIAVYSFGRGKDVKRPTKPREAINRSYRQKQARLEMLSAMAGAAA